MIKIGLYLMEDTIRQSSCFEWTILFGDTNARVGANFASWLEYIGEFGVKKMNENGQHLLRLWSRNRFGVSSTVFPGPAHREMSWYHLTSKT